MTRILHLTDLHLAPVDSDAILGDYKENFVPRDERQQRVGALRNALAEFAAENPEQLDAVVVSGDITISGTESGFELFEDVLGELGSACPPAERIVVVPGNHDVAWFEQPSTRAHYGFFLPYVHERGFVRPLLEGIDIRADPQGHRIPGTTINPVLITPDQAVVIIALNSSNSSGILEPTSLADDEWELAVEALGPDRRDAALEDLEHLRLRDAARVSPAQLAAARRELRNVRTRLKTEGVDLDRVVTIAVLHHQLLPVSAREELKTFEALSNLGQVREFLRAAGVDLVLHGHKHEGAIYRDSIPRPGVRLDPSPHDVLVVSGAAVGLAGYTGEAFRHIEIDTEGPLPRVLIAAYQGVPEGGEPRPEETTTAVIARAQSLGADGVARIAPVVGASVDEVYRRIVDELERLPGEGPVANLVCEVREPGDPYSLPPAYPALDDIDDPRVWVEELVSWWQEPRAALGPNLTFNHGGRIKRFGPRNIDQLVRVERALRQKAESSRAVVVLVDPDRDDVTDADQKFPAFCFAQLAIRESAGGPRRLDVTAYFRKQEMRWWWPVNVAELALMQRQLCDRLASEYDGLEPGAIVTVAGIAKAGKARPRVVVPKIDRLVDDDAAALWLLALAVALPETHAGSVLDAWAPILDDLVPDSKLDPDGVPVAVRGLEMVVEALQRLDVHGDAEIFMSALEKVLDKNKLYVQQDLSHATWVRRVTEAIGKARAALERLETNE